MALCKKCGITFVWGYNEETNRWVPLVPVEEQKDKERSYVDEDGTLRADHRETCINDSGRVVKVTRLAKHIPAAMAEEHNSEIVAAVTKTKSRFLSKMSG